MLFRRIRPSWQERITPPMQDSPELSELGAGGRFSVSLIVTLKSIGVVRPVLAFSIALGKASFSNGISDLRH